MRHRPGRQSRWGSPLYPPNLDPETTPPPTSGNPTMLQEGRSQGQGWKGAPAVILSLWIFPSHSLKSVLRAIPSARESIPPPLLQVPPPPRPFSRFLFLKLASLLETFSVFTPKSQWPLSSDSHPSFISRTGLILLRNQPWPSQPPETPNFYQISLSVPWSHSAHWSHARLCPVCQGVASVILEASQQGADVAQGGRLVCGDPRRGRGQKGYGSLSWGQLAEIFDLGGPEVCFGFAGKLWLAKGTRDFL